MRKLFGTRLWRDADFLKFWSGDTIAQFGYQVTLLALPLTAVLTLHAGAVDMGLLNAASYLPYLLLSLFTGVWIDRVRRRPVMVVSALGRAAVLLVVVLLSVGHRLDFAYLYGAALLLGGFAVFFDVTYQAYLPSLIEKDDLMEGNSKLQGSTSAAQVGGPALGGWLVHLLTAPTALVANVGTFLVSAVSLLAVRKREVRPEPPAQRRPIRKDIAEGLSFAFGEPSLRACMLEAGTYNLFWMVMQTVFLLYAVGTLHLSPGTIGLVMGGGAVGSLVGAVVANKFTTRLGFGPSVTIAVLTGNAALILLPAAFGPSAAVIAFFLVGYFINGAGTTISNIQVLSLRLTMTPNEMLGRMNASYRFVATGTVPLGALLAGVLGTAIGLRTTLLVGAVGLIGSSMWLVLSPIRSVRQLADVQPAADTVDADVAQHDPSGQDADADADAARVPQPASDRTMDPA